MGAVIGHTRAERVQVATRLFESIDDDELGDDPAAAETAWAEEIQRRVEQIRNGMVATPALQEVLAELEERFDAEAAYEATSDVHADEEPAEVERAWAEEIERRIEEVRAETERTYAAEDVMAALRARFG